MTRKPRLGLLQTAHQSLHRESFPDERRSVYVESLLCIAIRKRVLVTLLLKDYIVEGLFEPTIVYLSRKHQVSVTGIQITNPEKPLNNLEMRDFDTAGTRKVPLNEPAFITDPVIDRFDR